MFGTEAVVVDANDHRVVDGVAGRHREQRALGPGLQVLRDLIPGSKHAGGLDHHVHVEGRPGQLGGVALADHSNPASGGDQFVVLDVDAAFEAAHDRVIGEQVGKRAVVEQIVDGHDLDVARRLGDSKHRAADAAEAVDCHAHQGVPVAASSAA